MRATRGTWADEVGKREDALIVLRRDFHRHPELSFSEQRTAGIVAERLQAAGLEVRTGLARTGVVGVLRGDKPGRTIAWRADIDALPVTELLDAPFTSGAGTTATRPSRSPWPRFSRPGARSCRAPRSSSSSPPRSCSAARSP